MTVRLSRAALAQLAQGPEIGKALEAEGKRVRDTARVNARTISSRLSNAIESTPAEVDKDGIYVDVGYDKRKPGWVLWFHEVGTSRHRASPHLRPALKPGSSS